MSTNNTITWQQCREILFKFKQEIDQKYRNMLWHFSQGGDCPRCTLWDDLYRKDRAHVNTSPQEEVTDEELLEAAMEVDGTH